MAVGARIQHAQPDTAGEYVVEYDSEFVDSCDNDTGQRANAAAAHSDADNVPQGRIKFWALYQPMNESDIAKLDCTKAIYMNLIDLAWPETLLISANKNLHMIYEAPYHKDPSRMEQWSRAEIKADFDSLFEFIKQKYHEEAKRQGSAQGSVDQGQGSAQGSQTQAEPPAVQGDASQA